MNYIKVLFHKNNMKNIKKALGKNCTYLSHIRYKDKYGVIAKFKNSKPIEALLEGNPNDIKPEFYEQLKTDITNEARERGIL